LLSRLFFNTALEHFFFGFWSSSSLLSDEIAVAFETLLAVPSVDVSASQFDLHSIADLSLLSIDALDDLLSSDSLQVKSEDVLLTSLLELGSAYSRILRHVRFELLSWEGVSAFANHFAYFSLTESIWDSIAARLKASLDSLIVASFLSLLDEHVLQKIPFLERITITPRGIETHSERCEFSFAHSKTVGLI
jgi:hypothetical protein